AREPRSERGRGRARAASGRARVRAARALGRGPPTAAAPALHPVQSPEPAGSRRPHSRRLRPRTGVRPMTWIQTFTGKPFDLMAPDPAAVCLEDIAHALASTCRFSGHTRVPY